MFVFVILLNMTYNITSLLVKQHFIPTGLSLGYVTPWNSHGYDVAKQFKKFNMISPVWLQIKRKPRGKYVVEGCHDIDQGWVNDVRSLNHEVQVCGFCMFLVWISYISNLVLFQVVGKVEKFKQNYFIKCGKTLCFYIVTLVLFC